MMGVIDGSLGFGHFALRSGAVGGVGYGCALSRLRFADGPYSRISTNPF